MQNNTTNLVQRQKNETNQIQEVMQAVDKFRLKFCLFEEQSKYRNDWYHFLFNLTSLIIYTAGLRELKNIHVKTYLNICREQIQIFEGMKNYLGHNPSIKDLKEEFPELAEINMDYIKEFV